MSVDVWTLLEKFNVISGDFMFLAAVGGYLNRERIRSWLTRNRFPKEIGHPLDQSIRLDAIIFTVSKFDVPAWVIERLQPSQIGLIASHESLPAAKQIAEIAAKRQIAATIKTVDSPDDPAQSRAIAEVLIADWRKKDAPTVAVDVTGGKVPMSLGAFMAAEELGAYSLYISTRFDSELKKPDMATAKILCVSKPQ